MPLAGLEIEYYPYDEPISSSKIIENQTINNINENSKQDAVSEKLISDNSNDLVISSTDDSLSEFDIELNDESFISQELEKALEKLNQDNLKQTVSENNVQDTLVIVEDIKNIVTDGYFLPNNRLALIKAKPNYFCNKSGTVIVRVWVNREGVTIKAEAGIRGTTESAPCLLDEARVAALQTTWTPYLNAPDIQIGQITYNFYQN